MPLNKKRTFITYILINILMFLLAFLMYFVFTNKFNETYTTNYINQFQNVLTTNLDETLTKDYEKFNQIVNNESINNLNNNLDNFNIPFLSFLENNNNSFTYNNETINISNNDLNKYNFGFFNNYFYYFNENVVGVIDFSKYITTITNISNANNIFIMDKFGYIYFQTNDEIKANLLNEYINIDTSNYFTNYFSQNKDVTIKTNLNKNAIILNFTNLENINDLYFAQHFNYNDISLSFSQFNLYIALILMVLLIISILILTYIYNTINLRFADIEEKRLKYYYSKPFIIKINRKGKIVRLNKTTKNLFKTYFFKPETINDIFSNDDSTNVSMESIKRGTSFNFSLPNEKIRFIPIKSYNGYYLIGENISNFESSSQEIYKLAYYNDITNLPNYYLFDKELEIYIDDVKNEDAKVVILALDILEFTSIPHNFNQRIADKTLDEVGKHLNKIIKENKIEGRIYNFKGDKFIITIRNNTPKEVMKFAQVIFNEFEKPLDIYNNQINISFAAAIYELKKELPKISTQIIFDQITETLKQAKELVANKIKIFDEDISLYVNQKQQIEFDLEKAIKEKQFIVYLQPQYHTELDRITGFEALVRWDHPKYINKSPQEFIKLAEENGMIIEIGKQITEETFKVAKQLEKYNVNISLNVSPIQLLQQGFTEEFLTLFKKYELNANSITVEITETTLITSFKLVNEKIKILRKNGIKIHLDDFGTGYSSLPYIKELSLDAIKIDRMFIEHLETDKFSKALVNMIITLTKQLELQVIAEGVENQQQLKYLAKNGCFNIQGYLISPPLPVDKAINLLEEYNIKKNKNVLFKGGK